jgi:hypothetical protein
LLLGVEPPEQADSSAATATTAGAMSHFLCMGFPFVCAIVSDLRVM